MNAITRDLNAYLMTDDDAEPLPLDVRVAWSPLDPFAVQWVFLNTPTGDVRWTLAREVLAEALICYDTLGNGDVTVRRYKDACALRLEFNNPNGRAVAATCTTPVTEFLNATYCAMPPGCPEEREQVDHALAALLASVK